MAATGNTKRRPILSPKEVDGIANAVFTALTHDLDRPFMAGSRNVRSIVREWCPLSHGLLDADVDVFHGSYISAHFFDRYFYSSEQYVQSTLEDQAREKFVANLGRGYRMNEWRLEFIPYGRLNSILKSASLEVARILGDFNIEELFEESTHGPNSTLGVRKHEAYLDKKLTSWDGTAEALQLWNEYLDWNTSLKGAYEWMVEKSPEAVVVPGNLLSFVPKKFDSLRTMMIEPTINQFFQQGYGHMISSRLLRFGNVDLSTQPLCHRLLVKLITTHGLDIATIDWSQASDRIWLKLCQLLMPNDWFGALCTIRSPTTEYKGETLTLTMAGSMGCGFTFPLQTLLFLCLLRALARENGCSEFVSVFGDDCVCDSDLVPHVQWLADQLDWQLNIEKSFWVGGFRESCGTDAYMGRDCRPFFIERPNDVTSPPGVKAWLYSVYNQAVVALPPNCLHTHLDQLITSLFKELHLGRIQYVPVRFSVTSGIQVKSPDERLAGDELNTGSVDFDDIAQCYTFQYNGTRRKTVAVNPGAYYIWALMGKGVPRDFRRAVICMEEDPEIHIDQSNGLVPWKGVAYGTRKTSVHTWHYFIDES
jgi:hypothetical protein